MLIFRAFVRIVFATILYAVLLFGPAGTCEWWRAWVIVGGLFAGSVVAIVSLYPGHKDLLEERLKPAIQKGQPLADKITVLLFFATYCGSMVFSSLDVFRLHLMGRPGTLVSSLGLAIYLAGWWIAYLSLRENAFAAPVVKYQEERQQRVVDTGVYGVVRHPMYAGGAMLMIGQPLWLESYAGALLAALPITTLIARILIEERFLKGRLRGYDAYTEKVRYRFIPGLW